jgi:hypothetical protein
LSQTYFSLLETIATDHMAFLTRLDSKVFVYILTTISEGLSVLDTKISTSCCSALDHILTFIFKLLMKSNRGNNSNNESESLQLRFINDLIDKDQTVLQQILETIFNIIIFEDCRNQWSMSRPLLILILINEQVCCFIIIIIINLLLDFKYFVFFLKFCQKWQNTLIGSQPEERREAVRNCFNNLMNGIERSVSVKNRDKFVLKFIRKNNNNNTRISLLFFFSMNYRFTQNIVTFHRDINECLKSNLNAALIAILKDEKKNDPFIKFY